MKINFRYLLLITTGCLIIFSCTTQPVSNNVVIAISKASPVENYQSYINWLKNADTSVKWVDMYSLGLDEALKKLKSCDGLLLTGGEDIYPELYGQAYDSTLCDPPNRYRDSLEMKLFQLAIENNIPVMGICRGMQMINVASGGSLYFDLRTQKDTLVSHRFPNYTPARHTVNVVANSILANAVKVQSGEVYSNHHQGVRDLAHGLRAIAYANDSLVEAVQLTDTTGFAFLLGVQWHPEKMDFTNPLSGNIAKSFVNNVKSYHTKNVAK